MGRTCQRGTWSAPDALVLGVLKCWAPGPLGFRIGPRFESGITLQVQTWPDGACYTGQWVKDGDSS